MVESVVEFPAGVCPTGGKLDRLVPARRDFTPGLVGGVAVGLEDALEDERFRAVPFDPQDVIEAVVRPARPPIVKQRAVRGAIDPEVAGPGLAVIQIAHGSLIHLQIPRGEQACPQEPVKRAQPTGGQGFPVHHRLARDRHAAPLEEDRLLPVERLVPGVLVDDDLGDESGRRQASFLKSGFFQL